MKKLILLLATAFLLVSHPAASTDSCAIGGVVEESDGHPIAGAVVALGGGGLTGQRLALTSSDGQFLFDQLRPGRYTLSASKPAYVAFLYGQQRDGGPGGILEIQTGDRRTDLFFRLLRGAVISGHVFDAKGRPVTGATVAVIQSKSTLAGRAWINGNWMHGTTDDEGAYRLYSLPAGEFAVGAWKERAGGSSPGGSAAARVFPLTFAPSARSLGDASPVVAKASEETDAPSIVLTPSRLADVAGAVIRTSGESVSGLQIDLSPDGEGAEALPGGFAPKQTSTRADGHYRFSGIPPGRYKLSVRIPSTGTFGPGEWGASTIVVDEVDLSSANVSVNAAGSVAGRIEALTSMTRPDIRVDLVPVPQTASRLMSSRLASDGTFRFSAVPPGRYRLSLSPARGAVESAWVAESAGLNNLDVLDQPFDVSAGSQTDGIVVKMAPSSGQLRGRLVDATGTPVLRAVVVLFPASPTLPVPARRLRVAWSDGRGQYLLQNLPVGSYAVVAFPPDTNVDLEKLSVDGARLRLLLETAAIIDIGTEQLSRDITVKISR